MLDWLQDDELTVFGHKITPVKNTLSASKSLNDIDDFDSLCNNEVETILSTTDRGNTKSPIDISTAPVYNPINSKPLEIVPEEPSESEELMCKASQLSEAFNRPVIGL